MYKIIEANGEYQVVDAPVSGIAKPIVLEKTHDIKAAKFAVQQWKMRDTLQEEIQAFFDQMLEEYHGWLSDDEIRQTIREV